MSKTVKNKLVFTTKDADGKELKLAVRKPTMEEGKELQKIYNKAWKDAVDTGAPLRAKVDEIARQQNLWDDEKDKAFKALQKELFDSELKLAKGGAAGLTKKKAKELALRMSRIRAEMRDLTADRNGLDAVSVEAQADGAKFNHAVFLCTVNPDTNEKYFKNLEDFTERIQETATIDASRYMALLTYNLDPEYENSLPENKFLKEYGFVDEKLRLINDKGELVDSKGRRIREDGRFINEKGELIDLEGRRVDEQGNYIVEFTPFLEDDDKE